MSQTALAIKHKEPDHDLKHSVVSCAKFERSNFFSSSWQLINTFIPFFALVVLMSLSLQSTYWITLSLGLVAGGFMLRIFMIQHDCGHGSFFRSRTANELIGSFCSLITLIPYHYWRRQHAIHHSSNGHLDHRGHGDVDLYTVKEYLALAPMKKLKFRIARNPFMFMVFGPFWLLFGMNRFAFDKIKSSKRERRSVHVTNAFALTAFILLGMLFGFSNVIKIAAPIFVFSAAVGIWLFYIQHQYEHAYWKRDPEWDYFEAAVKGSSFYKLPRLFDWFTASIGYHHIHHLVPSIPNYHLRRCAESNPEFQEGVQTFTMFSGFKTLFLALWDEERQRLISFRELRKYYR